MNGALLDGLTDQVEHGPLLAATRLEGAVRPADSEAVRTYHVRDLLEKLPADGPEDFVERLPRVLGVAPARSGSGLRRPAWASRMLCAG
ncbi:hypothetical protein GCM10010309_78730 [Streptomyces violaceochromogenes]|nr:hypothetical protein GCM10010309_78730 [Streptomyces violaceochromogenes]